MASAAFGDHRDLALQSIGDYGQQLTRSLRGLELDEARWMPTPESNHILWILWHMGRMEDMWGQYLQGGGDSAWIEGGWADRLGIDPARNGVRDSSEQVRDFPDVSVEEVTAYWQAARDLLIPSVEGVTPDMLETKRPGCLGSCPRPCANAALGAGQNPGRKQPAHRPDRLHPRAVWSEVRVGDSACHRHRFPGCTPTSRPQRSGVEGPRCK